MKRKIADNCGEGSTSVSDSSDSDDLSDDNFAGNCWSSKDLLSLVDVVKKLIPANDSKKFDLTLRKVDWKEVQIGKHLPDDSKKKLEEMISNVRKFRTLTEIMTDIEQYLRDPHCNRDIVKKRRHPEKPKRPLTSYMIYYTENKHKVILEGKTDPIQVSKIMGERFNSLPEKKKQKYIQKAQVAKEVYMREMKAFYEKYPEEKVSKRGRLNKKPGPLPPRNAFAFYYQFELDKAEIISSRSEFRDRCLQKWKKLVDKKKGKYIQQAIEDEARYKKELLEYKEKNPNFIPSNVRQSISKEEQGILSRLAGKPEKPPNSGYSLYSKEMLNNDDIKKEFSARDRIMEIAKIWKNLTPNERKSYDDRAAEMLEEYKLQFASYLETLPEEKRKEELAKNVSRAKTSNNPFNIYCKQSMSSIQSKHPEMDRKKVRRMLRKEYEALPDEVKTAYMNWATNKHKKRPTLYKDEPEPPPSSVYLFFLKKYLSGHFNSDCQDRLKEGPRIWQSLASADKLKYKQKLVDARKEYIEKYDLFLKNLTDEERAKYMSFKNKNADHNSVDADEELSDVDRAETDDSEYESSSDSDHS